MASSKNAGRGLLAIASAKIYFIVATYAVFLLLPRLLGSAEEFGLFVTTISGVSILNNVLIVATIQTVSKFISERESDADAILDQAFRIQLAIGLILASALVLAAPSIGSLLLDDALVPLFRIFAIVVLAYALYAAIVGSLNGRHLFQEQARLDMTFTTLRSAGPLIGAFLGLSAFAAICGFALSSVLTLGAGFLAVRWSWRGKERGSVNPVPWKEWFAFCGPLWLYQLGQNGVLLIDVQVLKRTVTELAALQASAVDATNFAREQVAYYGAAQRFAFVPFQLIVALTFVIFPMISRATAAGDLETSKRLIRTATRVSILAMLALAAPIAGAADGVLRLAYPNEYLVGANALAILIFGVAAFAMFVVASTVLSSAGSPRSAAIVSFVSFVIVVVLNRTAVLNVGLSDQTLAAAATGTSVGMLIALLLSALLVYRRFGTFLSPKTFLRATLAAALAGAASHAFPHSSFVGTVLALLLGFLVYVVALFATGEITRADIRELRSSL
ncbi:MAG: oligosaccharide flippase family protein [Polyangiales bacterium]